VTAYISEISAKGKMTILFNATMFTDFNWTELNSTIVDIYIEPTDNGEKRNLSEPNLNISDWKVVMYNSTRNNETVL
jgi:hypothetical protein